jgi:YegS/Rv2252/BmrU family lipid kinase
VSCIDGYYNIASVRVGIVINPISGRNGHRRGEAERRRAFVQAQTAAAGIDATVVLTEQRGHARDLAQTFVEAQCETVIAMGGDGTVNEVAQALVGTPVALGILPCGSGDGLARGLGLPADADGAMRVALGAETRTIDVGDAGGRLFLNLAGIGFDATVARAFSRRDTRGFSGYFTEVHKLVWTYASPDYEVTWHSGGRTETRRGPKFIIGFANASSYGNGAVLAPDANPEDGLLDVVLVDAGQPLQQMWRARRLFWRRSSPARGVERAKATHAVVRGPVIVCHLDGEVFETSGELEIRVRPRALRVRAQKQAV